MQVTPTPFRGLLVVQPRVFTDDRGYFFEAWNKKAFDAAGIPGEYVQDNESGSEKNVIRGLHFQLPPHAQAKLVRVSRGAVLDVVVDLRQKEPTYMQHFKLRLDEHNHTMLYIPEGFAHGFLTLEDDTIFTYKCTKVYHRESDRGIRWNDPALGIDWESSNPTLSEKDQVAPLLKDFDNPF